MKPKLKNIFIFQNGTQPLEEATPQLADNFSILVSLTIGPDDQDGGHDYSFNVCTPRWLDHNGQNRGPIWGRHLLIVNQFVPEEIRSSVEKIIIQCTRNDWTETAVVLSRFFAWEFEDFQV